METAIVIVQNYELGDGGTTINAAGPTSPGNTLPEGQELVVRNKSIIFTEEREGTHWTVLQKQRCCFCPTEPLFPFSSPSDLCKDIMKSNLAIVKIKSL